MFKNYEGINWGGNVPKKSLLNIKILTKSAKKMSESIMLSSLLTTCESSLLTTCESQGAAKDFIFVQQDRMN
jgi:hypothetical protein